MTRTITYKNQPYILSRIHHARQLVELVSVGGCDTIFISQDEYNLLGKDQPDESRTHDEPRIDESNQPTRTTQRSTVPGNIEFPSRSPDFIIQLQQRRRELLEESRAAKRQSSGPRKGRNISDSTNENDPVGQKRVRKTGKSKKLDVIAEMERIMREKLATLPRKDSTT